MLSWSTKMTSGASWASSEENRAVIRTRWSWRRMAQRMRVSESAGEVLSNFFNDADVLLTRMEAGVAASLLSQALASGLGGEE